MMIISRQEFVKIINRLRDYEDLKNKINDLFKDSIDNREMDFMDAGSICIGHETIVVKLLEKIFNDRDILSWWIYECDYGRNFRMGSISQEKNGTIVNIDLSTPEKLYDYLVEELENS